MMLLIALLAVGSEPDAIRQDVEERIPVPSEWVLEWVESDGTRLDDWPKGASPLVMDRKGGKLYFFLHHILQLPLDRIVPAGRHFQVDFLAPDGNGKLIVFPGILRFDGSRLLLCVTDPSRKRPTEFATKWGDGLYLFSFKQKK